jgi:cytoskeletal protein CcmA (bactofilin family)
MSSRAPATPAGPEATPSRRITDAAAGPATVIGPRTRIKGEITGGDPVDLAGSLEGDSRITGLYRVRDGARVMGDVTATNIVVDGEVSGRVLIAEKVEVGAGARVRANVRARVVAIAEGAFFDGQVHMEGRSGPAAPTNFREKRRGRRGNDPQPPSR